jgi:hypothetical protein
MNRPRFQFPIVVALACSAAWLTSNGLSAQKAGTPSVPGWEYKMIRGIEVGVLGGAPRNPDGVYYAEQEPGLNKLAADGWELVAVQPDGLNFWYFLKRPKIAK